MNIKQSVLLGLLAGACGGLALVAQAETPTFEQMDRDGNGVITTNEAQESWLEDMFAQVDVNQDGQITKAEYEQAIG